MQLVIRELAKQHEGKSQETSGHAFELHTPVLELGLRGATHTLRVLSSQLPVCLTSEADVVL